MNSAADVWAKVLAILETELEVSRVTISTWFEDLSAVSLDNTKLVLTTPSAFKKETILNHHGDKIRQALKLLFSTEMDFKLYTEEEMGKAAASKNTDQAAEDEYSFERFIVGPSNAMAHAAAQRVASAPGQSYNPLLIYGGSGLGKTHLLKAIGAQIRRDNPAANVVFIKGDDFTNELINAIQTGTTASFRNKYRDSADALLVDDIQFIAGKEQTQEEFFHTFNALHENNKQIVLISDRPPKEMVALEERLRTRFEWGLMEDIQPPTFETRMAIISEKANRLGLELDQKYKEIIANSVTSNVRQLEGIVKKIRAYQELLTETVTQDTIERAIKDMHMEDGLKMPTVTSIIDAVCNYYNVERSAMLGRNKAQEIVMPRQIAMYLTHEILNLSYPAIKKHFNRDHTTVIHACTKIKEKILQEEEFRNTIKDIRKNILE